MRLSFKLKARNEKGSTEARAIYNVLGIENQKEFLSDLKLVYGASTSETGSILCDKFNVFYGFVWKNEIKFVPLPRQERMRWFTPPAVPGTAAWQSSVDIPENTITFKSLQVITCRDFYFSKDYFVVNNHSGILSYIDFHQESSSLSHLANHAKMVFCHFMRFL